MPPLGPGLAMAAGEASIGEDVCAKLTVPSNSKSARTSIVSRMMNSSCGILARKGRPLDRRANPARFDGEPRTRINWQPQDVILAERRYLGARREISQ